MLQTMCKDLDNTVPEVSFDVDTSKYLKNSTSSESAPCLGFTHWKQLGWKCEKWKNYRRLLESSLFTPMFLANARKQPTIENCCVMLYSHGIIKVSIYLFIYLSYSQYCNTVNIFTYCFLAAVFYNLFAVNFSCGTVVTVTCRWPFNRCTMTP